MKFWKSILFTFILFTAVAGVIVYTACKQDPCVNVMCKNGGACRDGLCNCPTGFDGPTCADTLNSRYIGAYAGFTSCNNGAQVIDTVFIFPVYNSFTNVTLVEKVHLNDTLSGVVSNNDATYDITITSITDTNYSKVYNATLQSDNTLVLNSYERSIPTAGDTIIESCSFVGVKIIYPY